MQAAQREVSAQWRCARDGIYAELHQRRQALTSAWCFQGHLHCALLQHEAECVSQAAFGPQTLFSPYTAACKSTAHTARVAEQATKRVMIMRQSKAGGYEANTLQREDMAKRIICGLAI